MDGNREINKDKVMERQNERELILFEPHQQYWSLIFLCCNANANNHQYKDI